LISAYGANWTQCTDEYALANVVHHLVAALREGTGEREWCVRALADVLADAGFARQKATVVAPAQILVDFAEATPTRQPSTGAWSSSPKGPATASRTRRDG
jgi:hypothetical protein